MMVLAYSSVIGQVAEVLPWMTCILPDLHHDDVSPVSLARYLSTGVFFVAVDPVRFSTLDLVRLI